MSNIKIQDVYQRRQYTATAGQTVFSVPFPFFENSDLTVWKDETELTLTTDYTVSGAGSPSGGSVTLTSAASSGDIITMQGLMPIDRTSIYSATISNLTGSDLNNDFNRDIVMLKQLETTQEILQLQYKPYAEVSQDVDVTRDRWLPRLDPLQFWAMNAAGTAIEAFDFDDGQDAPADANYYLGTSDAALPNAENLGALSSGLLKHSVSAGVSTPATAIAGTDYWAPGNDLTTPNLPVSGTDVTNKTYVDALAAGATWFNSVRVASTTNLSATYDNGTSGIGATLTANSNGAASIDGVSLSLNDRVLFKDQSNAFENGIYYVSQVGDGSNPAIYTRSEDFDQSAEIDAGDIVPAREGTANNDTFWVQTSDVNTIGTDSIDFALFGNNPSNVVTVNGTQTITGAKTFNDLALGGAMNADSNLINNVIDPVSAQDAATKNYVDNSIDWELVASADTTSGTNVDFTNLSNDYIAYKFIFSNVRPVTDGTSLQCRFSADNGSTFISTSNYKYRVTYFQGASTLNNSSTSATAIALNVTTGNATGEGVTGNVTLFAPDFGTRTKVVSTLQYTDSTSNFTNVLQSGMLDVSQAHNAIRFNFATGDFSAGFIRVYGIRK